MKEQFVTYEIAKKLKQKGFAEKCFTFYFKTGNIEGHAEVGMGFTNATKAVKNIVTAPLWQQAIDWLREEHKMLIKPSCINKELMFIVYDISTGKEKRLFSRESLEKVIEDALNY